METYFGITRRNSMTLNFHSGFNNFSVEKEKKKLPYSRNIVGVMNP